MSLNRTALLLVTMLVVGCHDDGTTSSANVSAVFLRLPHDSLFYGRTVRAVAVAAGDSNATDHPRFTWTSSDTSVAVVDSLGNVLGVGIGTAQIAAELNGERAAYSLRIVVQHADGGVRFSEGSHYYGSIASCAIAKQSWRLFCRSSNDSAAMYTEMPQAPALALSQAWTSLDARCALAADGRIFCWGSDGHFVFGGLMSGEQFGVQVRTSIRFSSFSLAGHSTMCGIRADDSVAYCWGHNDFYQVGREPAAGNDSMVAPVTGNLRAKAIATSNFRTCALDLEGAPYCWGGNGSGARGLGVSANTGFQRTPARVVGTNSFATISVAEVHQCALMADGRAFCWGENDAGQLGNGTRSEPVDFGPRPVAGDLRFSAIETLGFPNATCGLTTDHDLYCWGAFPPASISSRLGDHAAVPVHVAMGLKFRAMSAIVGHMCGITMDGEIVCW